MNPRENQNSTPQIPIAWTVLAWGATSGPWEDRPAYADALARLVLEAGED